MNEKKSKEEYFDLIPDVRHWLGQDGLSFFREVKEKYGKINAAWVENGIPHAVHFREGMAVRNHLRLLTHGSWTTHEYDNTWTEIIEECIKIDW